MTTPNKHRESTAQKIMDAFEGDGWPGVDYIKDIIADHDQSSPLHQASEAVMQSKRGEHLDAQVVLALGVALEQV